MSERFQLPASFWRLQFQLLGGHRRMWMVFFVYVTIMLVGVGGTRRALFDQDFANIAGPMATVIASIQGFVLVLGGANSIYRATLRDFQTRMIESHRLSALPRSAVVLGYLFGGSLQTLLLFAINLVVGAFVTGFGKLPVDAWILGNLCMLNGSVTIWSMSVCNGVGLNKPISPAAALLGIGLLTVVILPFPAAGMMSGVYSSFVGINLITGRMKANQPEVLALFLVQALLTVYWVWIAGRKYRRPDLPALNAGGGLTLLVLWLLIGVAGIVLLQARFRPGVVGSPGEVILSIQWMGTLIGGLMIGSLAISGSVESRYCVLRGRLGRNRWDAVSDFGVSLTASAIIALIMGISGVQIWTKLIRSFDNYGLSWLLTVLTCTSALLTARGAFAIAQYRVRPARRAAGALIGGFWVLPPMLDGLRMLTLYVQEFPTDLSMLSGFSPFGSTVLIWRGQSIGAIWPGLVFQMLIAVLISRFAYRAVRQFTPRSIGTVESLSSTVDTAVGDAVVTSSPI